MAKTKSQVEDNQIDDDEDDGDSIVSFSENIQEAEAPEPLPESTYPATCIDATKGESKNGDPMAILKYKIAEEDYPADYDVGNAPGGTTLTFYAVMQDTAAGRYRTKQLCENMGAPMSKNVNIKKFIGLACKLTLKHEEYEGIMRAKIGRVMEA